MSAPLSNLVELPIEVLEQILLHLPGQDTVKMEAVNRHLRDLIRNFPSLQHQRELFAIGLIDNPRCPCDLSDRRKLREQYAHKWSNVVGTMARSTPELPPSESADWGNAKYLGNGYLGVDSAERNGLAFLRIPPVVSRRPVEGWSIPSFTFKTVGFAAYPPEDVLAVAEQGGKFIRTHLLNLRDGSPHPSLPSNTITWELPPATGIHPGTNDRMAITASRVMVCGFLWDYNIPGFGETWKVVVWDWKTGNLLLDLSFARERRQKSEVIFLDEFRMVIIPNISAVTELTVVNTLIPQDHPENLLRLGVPRQFYHRNATIHIDRDRPLGTPSMEEPLIADPAQSVIALEREGSWGPLALFVVRMQALIEQTCPAQAGSRVPWEEWGRDAVVVEVPAEHTPQSTFVHGAQVVVTWITYTADEDSVPNWYYLVFTLDLGLRGGSSLRRWRGGADRAEVNRLPGDRGAIRCQPDHGMDTLKGLGSLSDGTLFHLGKGTPGGECSSDITLHVWELI